VLILFWGEGLLGGCLVEVQQEWRNDPESPILSNKKRPCKIHLLLNKHFEAQIPSVLVVDSTVDQAHKSVCLTLPSSLNSFVWIARPKEGCEANRAP
jgi:hypothetical protein